MFIESRHQAGSSRSRRGNFTNHKAGNACSNSGQVLLTIGPHIRAGWPACSNVRQSRYGLTYDTFAMITREDALRIAVEYLGRPDGLPPEDEWIVVDEDTIERSWGWVLFHTSKLWRETGEIRYAVAGNAPLIVEREGGRIFVTGTSHPVEHYIESYERHGNPLGS